MDPFAEHLDQFLRHEISLDALSTTINRLVTVEQRPVDELLAALSAPLRQSALDPETRSGIARLILAAASSLGVTVLDPSTSSTAQTNEDDRTRIIERLSREPAVGGVIRDRFELVEELGAGGMGKVFKARDRIKVEAQDRQPFVALKVLSGAFRRHEQSAIALQREAKKALSLSHSNIVRVYDFDRDGPITFMTMEYLSGRSLDKEINAAGFRGVSVDKVVELIQPAAEALAYAHGRGFVHSDFKPSNVFVTEDNQVRVIDFGIARVVRRAGEEAQQTAFDASALGALTPAYASPEQCDGLDPDPRDDIYALACVTYELLTGRHPFDRKSGARARAEKLEPVRPPALDGRQWRGLQQALAFDRQSRTAGAMQVIEALLPPRRSSRRVLIGAGIGATLALLAGFAWWVLQEPTKHQSNDAAVLAVIDGMSCTVLSADVRDGAIILSGLVGPEVDLESAVGRLRALEGISDVTTKVDAFADFHCPPIDVLRPFILGNRRQDLGLAISPGRPIYYGGDDLEIEATTKQGGYLTIDLFSRDGNVLHMLPRPGARDTLVAPGTQLRLGQGGDSGSWGVAPPYGRDLAAILSTPEPLDLGGERPELQRAADYLPALRQALARLVAGKGGEAPVAADFAIVTSAASEGR